MPIKRDIELGQKAIRFSSGVKPKPEDRLILAGRGLSDELDKIIAEEDFQERAGILEFMADFSREEAERRAREEMRKRAAKNSAKAL